MKGVIEEFIEKESSSGILLIFVTVLALLISNSSWLPYYQQFLSIPIAIQIGPVAINKALFLWVNDGLMAIFFFLIGLEVKRELLEGHLSSIKQAILPLVAAIGG
ncbi:MAG TPA: Na(+)/H(+) antiporter NhaA, partial [Gammaproteobacteria bacterium]|nr:Na(+)/H(+) antiporter NhaA [Gammaproteobacteria bacterium]